MRSIEKRFAMKLNPAISSYLAFSQAVRGQNFTKGMIARWFNKLVEKDDYDPADKKALISHLFFLSSGSEDDKI